MPARTSFLQVLATVPGRTPLEIILEKRCESQARYKDHPNSPVANIFSIYIFFNKINNIYVYIIHIYVYLLQYIYT